LEPIVANLSLEPPPVLYHYTTQTGLLGIIESGEIWASDMRYLNDATEFMLALELARKIVLSLDNSTTRPHEYARISELSHTVEMITVMKLHVFVCSFSEVGDSLGQWRGYGNAGVAYSIGFQSAILKKLAVKNAFRLVKCVYDPQQQATLVDKVVYKAYEMARDSKAATTEGKIEAHQWELALRLVEYAPLLKHESFAEEREWRLISKPVARADHIKFRPGLSTIVPYLPFPLKLGTGQMEIHRIIVGPSPHMELSIKSMKSFFESKGLENVEVVPSNVPYRNW
jgi:hypothetical protein